MGKFWLNHAIIMQSVLNYAGQFFKTTQLAAHTISKTKVWEGKELYFQRKSETSWHTTFTIKVKYSIDSSIYNILLLLPTTLFQITLNSALLKYQYCLRHFHKFEKKRQSFQALRVEELCPIQSLLNFLRFFSYLASVTIAQKGFEFWIYTNHKDKTP